MKRYNILAGALALVTALAINSSTFAKGEGKTVVLVHGAFADGSSWNKVIPILQNNGLKTIAVQIPMTSLKDDVAFAKRAIKNAGGNVVLVGHSWGGVVITEAGADKSVSALVYLSAFAPAKGQHIKNILKDGHGMRGIPHVPGLAKKIVDEDGFIRLSDAAIVQYFAPDIPRVDARLIAAGQGKVHKDALGQAPSTQAWDSKPTWYVVTTNDQMIAPDLQKLMAKRIGAKTTELSASHVSMLSMPQEVANVILEAAK